jgi:hypothetical protein
MHFITFHYISLHFITFHYISLHFITLHYITVHHITSHHIYVYTFIFSGRRMNDDKFSTRSDRSMKYKVKKHDFSWSRDDILRRYSTHCPSIHFWEVWLWLVAAGLPSALGCNVGLCGGCYLSSSGGALIVGPAGRGWMGWIWGTRYGDSWGMGTWYHHQYLPVHGTNLQVLTHNHDTMWFRIGDN